MFRSGLCFRFPLVPVFDLLPMTLIARVFSQWHYFALGHSLVLKPD
jgi:hypothetical protein